MVVIKHEKKNDKVFRTQEKAEIESQIFGLLKAHISIIGRTPLGKLFSLSADDRALSKTNAQTTYNRQDLRSATVYLNFQISDNVHYVNGV